MTSPQSGAAATALGRLDAARLRLEAHAALGPPAGLTDPDPGGEERWEAGQVWAHLAEFPPYWDEQLAIVTSRWRPGGEPVPFGRTRTDPSRIAAIERDRHADPRALLERVQQGLAAVADRLRTLPTEAWAAIGLHPTLGEMTVPQIVERFLSGHLEEHADQLDLLRSRG